MTYYLFRHSETYFSKHNIRYGKDVESAEIIPEGIPATKRLAYYLASKNIDAYFSSPFKRCVQTAEIIEKITGKKFTIDPRIGEEMINYGKETFEEVAQRLKSFLKDLNDKNFQSVAVCSHGWPIAAMKALITKGSVEISDLGKYPPSGVLIEIKDSKVSQKDFNL